MSEVKPDAADENVVPLEAPQARARVKGLFPRGAVLWAAILFLGAIGILAARDLTKNRAPADAPKAAAGAASVPESTLGPKPGDQDMALLARRQIDVEHAQEAASAAAAARRPAADRDGVSDQIAGAGGARSAGGQAGTVQPAVPNPSHPSPMGDVRGPGQGAPYPRQSGGAGAGTGGGEEVDAAAVQAEVAKHMGAIVSLQGDEDAGTGAAVKGAVDAVQQAGGGGGSAVDSYQKAADAAMRQVQGLMKTSGGPEQPGAVMNAVAAVAHPTSRDVAWLKEYASEGAPSASQPEMASVTRAKILPTRNVVLRGTRIPIVSREAVNSDQPADITVTSRSDVYDSLTQTKVLIPAGTRFNGRYSSEIRPGQTRLLFAFNRMVLPDGRIVDLMGSQGSDNLGRAGVEGSVDNHFLQMFGYSMAIAWIGNKVGNSGASTTTIGANGQVATSTLAGQVLGQVSQQILQRNSTIPPTITKEAAVPLFITITGDIALEPWRKAQ